MPGHHFENVGPEPDEDNLLQTVKCLYCQVVDERRPAPVDPDNPTTLAQRLYEARSVPPDADCPKAPEPEPQPQPEDPQD